MTTQSWVGPFKTVLHQMVEKEGWGDFEWESVLDSTRLVVTTEKFPSGCGLLLHAHYPTQRSTESIDGMVKGIKLLLVNYQSVFHRVYVSRETDVGENDSPLSERVLIDTLRSVC